MLTDAQFWQFSLSWYARPGVSQACIELQDKLGLNVNLMLLLCWCEQQNLQLSAEQIERLGLSLKVWSEKYTQPLRQLRRQIALEDHADESVKHAIFDAEMALEKSEQRLLICAFSHFNLTKSDEAAQNLTRYVSAADSKAVMGFAKQIAVIRGS